MQYTDSPLATSKLAMAVPVGQLLAAHRGLLAQKQVMTQQALIQIMQHDWAKFIYALQTIQQQQASQLLDTFFAKCPEMTRRVLPQVRGDRLYHIGFESYTPFDIFLSNLPNWLAVLNQTRQHPSDAPLQVTRLLRFPASQALQTRVHAYTEIIRLWLQAGQQEFMLELFDIYHTVARRWTRQPINGALARQGSAQAALFQDDAIWHYALYVENATMVGKLHHEFCVLAEQVADYQLAYPAPVQNTTDGSFHTKLRNLAQGLEIEFVTQLAVMPVTATIPDLCIKPFLAKDK